MRVAKQSKPQVDLVVPVGGWVSTLDELYTVGELQAAFMPETDIGTLDGMDPFTAYGRAVWSVYGGQVYFTPCESRDR